MKTTHLTPLAKRPLIPGFMMLDFPDEDEVDHKLSSEGKLVEAILHRRGLARRLHHLRFRKAQEFRNAEPNPVDVRFVHLAAHANRSGVGFYKGSMTWPSFAKCLVQHLQPLGDSQRVMVFSCCCSLTGFEATREVLKGHFTGAYFLSQEEPDFCDALTIWSMFYLKKEVNKPHGKILDAINTFFGDEILMFKSYR